MREHRGAATVLQGARLHASLILFTLEASGVSLPLEGCDEPPPLPALYAWLRRFQTSSA